MEGITTYQNYRSRIEERDRTLEKSRMLERESSFYASRIKQELSNFLADTKIRSDCQMRNNYCRLL